MEYCKFQIDGKKMKKRVFIYIIVAVVCAVTACVLTCDALVRQYADGKVYSAIEDIPGVKYGLVLGTTPQTRIGGRRNLFFMYRMDAAAELYHAGKVQYLVVSGDEHSLEGINEPECMRDSLVVRGVPKNVIILDGKGYRTLDSVVRMRKTFGVRTFTIISQQFHNERALYIAGHWDLDVEDVLAYNAISPRSTWALMTYIREYLARVKLFVDMLL